MALGILEKRVANGCFHGWHVEVADRHHRHQVGTIPAPVELPRQAVGKVLEILVRADGQPLAVHRAVQHHGELLVLHARRRAAAAAPLLDHHAALLAQLRRIEGDVVRPILENVEARLERGPACRWGP